MVNIAELGLDGPNSLQPTVTVLSRHPHTTTLTHKQSPRRRREYTPTRAALPVVYGCCLSTGVNASANSLIAAVAERNRCSSSTERASSAETLASRSAMIASSR